MSTIQIFGGGWTETKLEKVSAYLKSYTTALKNQPFRLTYIDGFAGTGRRTLKEDFNSGQTSLEAVDNEPIIFDGSAKLALENEPSFSDFIFIEKCSKRFQELKTLVDDYPDKKIVLENEDVNVFLQKYCGNKSWSGHRAVLFLDPFGLDVSWETLKCIATTQAIDMWLLFPLSGVNRMLPRTGEIEESWIKKLNFLFGVDDWQNAFYQPSGQQSLLPELTSKSVKTASFQGITDYWVKRLATIFPREGIIDTPYVLYNTKGSPQFLLCFASGNLKGAPIAKKIAQATLKD